MYNNWQIGAENCGKEYLASNQVVGGSSPSRRAISSTTYVTIQKVSCPPNSGLSPEKTNIKTSRKNMKKRAIVTGTSRGIGHATAAELLRRGWEVVGLARGAAPPELDELFYKHHRLDLGDLEALDAWCEAHLGQEQLSDSDRLGLVSNAALIEPVGPACSLSSRELSIHLAVNVVAPTYMAGFLLEHAPINTPLRVINLSSGAATQAQPGWTAYCASKAALRMTGEVLAAEVQTYPEFLGRNVAVVTYAPNVVNTRMQKELRAMDEARFPAQQQFVDLDREGFLVPANGPAEEIADLLDRDGLPPYSELRYHPPG